MTDEEIHNIYLHMSGKAEGLVEATGNADFPVLFARAILEYEGMTKDMQNMASKSTYKEQLETKDEPVAWMNRHGACKTSLFMEVEAGAKEEYTIPVYTTPQRTWVGLTPLHIEDEYVRNYLWERALIAIDDPCPKSHPHENMNEYCQHKTKIEAKLKEKNHGN